MHLRKKDFVWALFEYPWFFSFLFCVLITISEKQCRGGVRVLSTMTSFLIKKDDIVSFDCTNYIWNGTAIRPPLSLNKCVFLSAWTVFSLFDCRCTCRSHSEEERACRLPGVPPWRKYSFVICLLPYFLFLLLTHAMCPRRQICLLRDWTKILPNEIYKAAYRHSQTIQMSLIVDP